MCSAWGTALDQASRGPMGQLRWPGIQPGGRDNRGALVMLEGSANSSVLVSTKSERVCVPPWLTCTLCKLRERRDLALCVYAVSPACGSVCDQPGQRSLRLCVFVVLSLGHVPSFATGWSSSWESSSCIPQSEQRPWILGTGLGSSSWAAENWAGAAGAGDHISHVTKQCYDNTCWHGFSTLKD